MEPLTQNERVKSINEHIGNGDIDNDALRFTSSMGL